jgi:hypothetical protein
VIKVIKRRAGGRGKEEGKREEESIERDKIFNLSLQFDSCFPCFLNFILALGDERII